MKVGRSALFLCAALYGATAAPRGTKVRGRTIRRNLQMEQGKEEVVGGKQEDAAKAGDDKADKAEAEGVDLIETHPCEQNAETAKAYVAGFGYPEQGDMDCFADPVNACPGGCCRYSNYFICDEDNSNQYMPCVCNENTATVANNTAGTNSTESGNLTAVERLTVDDMEEEFPEDLDPIQNQNGPPLAVDAGEEENVPDKKDRHWDLFD